MSGAPKSAVCGLCGKTKSLAQGTQTELMRAGVLDLARREKPDLDSEFFVCQEDLNRLRVEHIEKLLAQEKGELSDLEEQVVESLRQHDILTENVNEQYEQAMTFGDRLSDRIAEFGGSWRFILSFGAVLLGWIVLNSVFLTRKPFDPFPYILLNLVLSCIAALQAPVIMMSQNRQEARDRLRSENDYRINLKAELEIRILNERVEHLLKRQWQRLLEIQEIQTELMREIARDRTRSPKSATQAPARNLPDATPGAPEGE